ncbi:MAG: FAD-dependent monooxygenase [Hyphomicrobiaceae bacterium]
MSTADTSDVVIAGTGPVGLAAAVGLAQLGVPVTLIGPDVEASSRDLDPRTFALFEPAIHFLTEIGVWPGVQSQSAPLRAIRLVDDTRRLFKAPEVLFAAAEVGLAAFGHNIPHAVLIAALGHRLDDLGERIRRHDRTLADLRQERDHVVVNLDDGRSLTAGIVIGADGRRSICRRLAGMATRQWSYPQTALVVTVAHSRPHHDISTELHRRAGPLATVPLPGGASSIVWLEEPAAAKRLASLDDAEFCRELHAHLQGLLGTLGPIGPRVLFPLEGLIAEPAGTRRVALAGEALHAFPPIGAQGLNLGFRDVANLIDCVAEARSAGHDIGSDATLDRYAADRRRDVGSRTLAVDTLDRTLFSSLLPLQLARGAGLHLLKALPALRRQAIRAGMGQSASLPTMMRPREGRDQVAMADPSHERSPRR